MIGQRVRVVAFGVHSGEVGVVVDHDQLHPTARRFEHAVLIDGCVLGFDRIELEVAEQHWLQSGSLNDYGTECHEANAKWWHTAEGERLERNKGELLMLIVSELAEAMEGERKDLMDDKIPDRKMVEVELADALIRIFDYAAAHGLDLQGAYEDKMTYNATREDHTHEARSLADGKKF